MNGTAMGTLIVSWLGKASGERVSARITHQPTGAIVSISLDARDAEDMIRDLRAVTGPAAWLATAASTLRTNIEPHKDALLALMRDYSDRDCARECVGHGVFTNGYGARVKRGEHALNERDARMGRPVGSWRTETLS